MKDLVHIFELEDLLQEANNPLVRQAKEEGPKDDGGDGDWSIEIVNYEKFDDNEIVYNNNFIFLKVHQLQQALRLCGIEKEIII